MPHILIQGSDKPRVIEQTTIHAHVVFSKPCFNTNCAEVRLQQLKAELEAVIEKYFDNSYSSETYSNHEWNVNFK